MQFHRQIFSVVVSPTTTATVRRVLLAVALAPDELASLAALLEADGVKSVSATDSTQALKEANSHPLSLAFVDVNLAGSGGLELCRRLTSLPKGATPVILRLSTGDAHEARQALEAGALHGVATDADVQEIYLHLRNQLRIRDDLPLQPSLPCSLSGLAPGGCLLDTLPGAVIISERLLTVVDANAAVAEMTGLDHEELLHLTLPDLFVQLRLGTDFDWLKAKLVTDSVWQGELYGRSANGEAQAFWLHAHAIKGKGQHEPIHYVFSLSDITHHKYREQRLRTLAETDALTGLANRNLLMTRFNEAIAVADSGGNAPAILFLDLDQFKHVNDQFGHAEGDRILREVAGILEGCVRTDDLVARLGGDEFAVLLSKASSRLAQEDTAKRIVDRLVIAVPNEIERRIEVTCSVGVAGYPRDGCDAAKLLKVADKAMYSVKGRGKNGYCFASAEEIIVKTGS